MDEDIELSFDELQDLKEKKFNVSCCRSYLTPRGRCYTCPEQNLSEEDEE